MVLVDETVVLKAGKLTARFVKGELRSIRWGEFELVNRIYFAVRDANWNTIDQVVENLVLKEEPSSFSVRFDCFCREGGIDFRWKCQIEGDSGRLTFAIDGESYSAFHKNRIGFCILHPLSCRGERVLITHSDGSQTNGFFPRFISPHQPFKDIAGMEWSGGGNALSLRFTGDVFEMEDQRNWTDASYKTYCTSLDEPFPVGLERGDRISQRIELRIDSKNTPETSPFIGIPIIKVSNTSTPLPRLGLETNGESLDEPSVTGLKKLNLSHLRVEARTFEAGWREAFKKRVRQVVQLDLPVELIVICCDLSVEDLSFIQLQLEGLVVRCILPIDEGAKSTSSMFLKKVRDQLACAFPSVPIGGGTNCYFTELNRFRPPFAGLDFVSFSINPQVHAFEDEFLIETNQSLGDIMRSIRHMSGTSPVHISPITLKPRFNPDATAEAPLEEQKRSRLDLRQRTVFNMLWTVACIKQLAQSGVESATFFQTVGEEGVCMTNRASRFSEYPAVVQEIFPVFKVFEILGEFQGGRVIHTSSSNPLEFDAIILENDHRQTALLVNHTDEAVVVEMEGERYMLDPKTMSRYDY